MHHLPDSILHYSSVPLGLHYENRSLDVKMTFSKENNTNTGFFSIKHKLQQLDKSCKVNSICAADLQEKYGKPWQPILLLQSAVQFKCDVKNSHFLFFFYHYPTMTFQTKLNLWNIAGYQQHGQLIAFTGYLVTMVAYMIKALIILPIHLAFKNFLISWCTDLSVMLRSWWIAG